MSESDLQQIEAALQDAIGVVELAADEICGPPCPSDKLAKIATERLPNLRSVLSLVARLRAAQPQPTAEPQILPPPKRMGRPPKDYEAEEQ